MAAIKTAIRVLLKHYWIQSYKAAAAARKIREVDGEGVLKEWIVQRWFHRLGSRNINIKVLPRAGMLAVWETQNIR